jgi:hypothetical protein
MRQQPSKVTSVIQPAIVATAGERRNNWSDSDVEKFLRDSLSPPEFWAEATRRWGEREKQIRERLRTLRILDEKTVASQKEIAALEMDLAAVGEAKRHAAKMAGLK